MRGVAELIAPANLPHLQLAQRHAQRVVKRSSLQQVFVLVALVSLIYALLLLTLVASFGKWRRRYAAAVTLHADSVVCYPFFVKEENARI